MNMSTTVLSSGSVAPAFATRAWDSQRRYADRIGADFRVVRQCGEKYPYALKWKAIEQIEDGVVLWMDWDLEVGADTQDLLPCYDADAVGTVTWKHAKFRGLPLLGTWLMLASVEMFAKIAEVYWEILPGLPPEYPNDEQAFTLAVNKLQVPTIELPPEGLTHRMGAAKWREE